MAQGREWISFGVEYGDDGQEVRLIWLAFLEVTSCVNKDAETRKEKSSDESKGYKLYVVSKDVTWHFKSFSDLEGKEIFFFFMIDFISFQPRRHLIISHCIQKFFIFHFSSFFIWVGPRSPSIAPPPSSCIIQSVHFYVVSRIRIHSIDFPSNPFCYCTPSASVAASKTVKKGQRDQNSEFHLWKNQERKVENEKETKNKNKID